MRVRRAEGRSEQTFELFQQPTPLCIGFPSYPFHSCRLRGPTSSLVPLTSSPKSIVVRLLLCLTSAWWVHDEHHLTLHHYLFGGKEDLTVFLVLGLQFHHLSVPLEPL